MFVDTFLLETGETTPGSGTVVYDAGMFMDSEVVQPMVVISDVTFSSAIFDGAHFIQDTDFDYEGFVLHDITQWAGNLPPNWTWKTVLAPNFNGNLMGGSVDYSASIVSEIRVRKRLAGEFRWKTIYVQDINTTSDFVFDFYDMVTASNTRYEYAYVPLINGIEGPIISVGVDSFFHDFFICDVDQSYHAIMNSENSITYNQETATQTTINRKKPFIIKNGAVGYYNGTLQATWMELKTGCIWDAENGAIYRKQVDQFLANGNTKIVKDWQGNIFLASIVSAIPQNTGDHPYMPVHQIEWVECGDYNSIADLYDNGFIDTDLDRE